jgi:hypothetical protein
LEISAEQFRQIVADCRRQAGEGGGDKRRSPRVGVRYMSTVRPIAADHEGVAADAADAYAAPDAPFTARLRDVSANGVGLTCRVPVAGHFTLEMPDADGNRCAQRCRVVRCRKVDKDQFLIGAAFVE